MAASSMSGSGPNRQRSRRATRVAPLTPSRCRSICAASGASPARASCSCSSRRRFCAAIIGCAMPSARWMASESSRGGASSRLKCASTSRSAAPASATAVRAFSRSTDFLSSCRSRSSAPCTSSAAGVACASPVRSKLASAVPRSRRPIAQLFIQPQSPFLVLLQLLELIASQAVHVRRKALQRRLAVLPSVDGIGQPQRLFQVFAPDAGRHRHLNAPSKSGQLRFLPIQADIFIFHAPARPSRVSQYPCLVNGEPAPDLDPGLAQVEVAVQLAPQTFGQRLVVCVAIVEQVLHGQTKQPDPIRAGERRPGCDLTVAPPDNLVAVAAHLPAGGGAFELRFQGQGRRVGSVALQKVLERTGQDCSCRWHWGR